MDVKLIGDTTYGKPVGFFPIDIFDFAIYPISFKTVNSAGNADYYTGFAPDKVMFDGFDKDWGDETEACLAEGIVQGGADAVLAASIFHYGQHTVAEAKALLASRGIPVRQ